MSENINKDGLTEEDLRKSLDKIEQFVAATPDAKKNSLLQKAMDGKISSEENVELVQMLSGQRVGPSLGDEFTKSLTGEQTDRLEKALAAQDFLTEVHEGLVKSLAAVGATMEKSQSRQDEYNLVLAKGVLDIGKALDNSLRGQTELRKSLDVITSTIVAFGRQPAHAPRSAGVIGSAVGATGALEKSLGGNPPVAGTDSLTKSQVLESLSNMNMSSKDGKAECGVDFTHAIAGLEAGAPWQEVVPPALLKEIREFRKSRS